MKQVICRNWKTGKLYKVEGVAKHSETLEDLVVYRALYDNPLSQLWVRPAVMFTGDVDTPEGKKPRFALVEELPARKMVFIGHPISGDIQGNIKKVLEICQKVHGDKVIPVAPYLISLQYLNDSIPEDRARGIAANLEMFYRGYIDEVWLYGDRISSGMEEEIACARKLHIPIFCKSAGTEKDFAARFSK